MPPPHRFRQFIREPDDRAKRVSTDKEKAVAAAAPEELDEGSIHREPDARNEAGGNIEGLSDNGKGCGMFLLVVLAVSIVVGAVLENRELKRRIIALEAAQQARS